MALSDESLVKAARLLEDAYDTRMPIEPLTAQFPHMTVADAYQVQRIQVGWWRAVGRIVRGHKVGRTSPSAQQRAGADQPDFGHLTSDMFFRSDAPIDPGEFLQPRIEPELALVLSRELRGPGVTEKDAAPLVAAVHPALEIIDSRIQGWDASLVDMIADNASAAGVILGAACEFDPAGLADLSCELQVSGKVVGTGHGSDVLGSPLRSLVWLANRLAEFDVALLPGDVILTGSLTAAVDVKSGDLVTATIGGTARVTAEFR